MPKCPFAVWKPISGSSGSYLGGPFKIVHHTTEGSTAAGAMGAYRANRSDPHFTVDASTIYQHIDTSSAARALRNLGGGVQTNRDSAIQIEVVGFAGRPKNRTTLQNVARLCRWIEQTHGVPRVWPNGFPKPARSGRDPGGHNRNRSVWDTRGGHYGHCHVPENDHWDPGYTQAEVSLLMGGVLRTQALGVEALDLEATLPSILDLDPFSLIAYPIAIRLDANGFGYHPIEIAAERVVSLVPRAKKNEWGIWATCQASLYEEQGETFVVAQGQANSEVTVWIKVLEERASEEEEIGGCPHTHDEMPDDDVIAPDDQTIDNITPIEYESEEVPCDADPHEEETLSDLGVEAFPFPGVNLQLPPRGTGFYSYSSNRAKQFGLPETIQAIGAIASDWFNRHSAGPVIGIGNISLRGGGRMPPHASHQRGLDVDFRLLRSDGARVGVRYQDPSYSRSRTQELVNTIRRNPILPIDIILFNDRQVSGVIPFQGHDDHLHVRFRRR